MEASHHSSDLDPASVLGFGSALAMLDSADEVGHLLTGALRSMGLADLQAVVLTMESEPPCVLGSAGTRPLPDAVVDELRQLVLEGPRRDDAPAPSSRRQAGVSPDRHPALADAGVRCLSLVRLGTIDHDFGVVVAGQRGEASLSPLQTSTLQMMAAQASMALHRLRLDRQKQDQAEALRTARDQLEDRVEARTAELERANEQLRRQAKRLKALRDVDRAILEAESPHEIASVAARRAQDIVPCERVSVSVIDRDARQVQVLTADQELADDDDALAGGTTLPLDAFFVPDAVRSGKTDVIPDLDEVPLSGTAKTIREKGIRSVLFLPMMGDDTLIGILKMGRSDPDAFARADRQVGRELADHLAIALRQAQLLEEVQEQRERLEERVRERTAELESFTYSVSHDLRTPLRAIDGYTRILKEEHADQLDDEGRRLLDTVYESTQTMGTLIDDLLTLSRLGRREMHRVPVDVCALAREAFEELERAQPAVTADVAFTCPSLPAAHADRSMIRQVLINLLSNALKFARDEDAPHIEIGAEDRGDEVVYFVRDNGVGFNMEYADKLFGVFERLHDDSAFEGTGVGLALVERIVRRHDGAVWGRGAKGEGATIYFTLPKPTSSPDG